MKSLLTLKSYFAKYKGYLTAGIILIVFSNIFGIVIPPVVREAVDFGKDLMLGNEPEHWNRIPNWFKQGSRFAMIPGLIILIAALFKAVFLFYTRMTLIIMSRYVEYDLKNTIFKHYQSLGQSFYGQNYTGDLMNRITEDVSKVRSFAGPAVMYSINLSIMIMMVVGLMFYINAKITMYVLIPLPVLAFIIYKVSNAMNVQSDLIQQKLSSITSFAQESFAGIHVLKSFASERHFSNEFDQANEEYKKSSMKLVFINALFMPTVIALVGVSILITIYVGGKEAIAGNFTLGNIVEYVIYVNMLTWPVASLGYVTSLVQQGAASMSRINQFLDIPIEEDIAGKSIDRIDHEIEFKEVSFIYPETDTTVLDKVSFTIKKGDKFGIIGTTGSGKSTIAKLLMQVYEPTSGSILIDGVDSREYSKRELRQVFGYVAQDIFLFSETIRENILLGTTKTVGEEQLQKVVEMANLKAEIDTFSDGMETMLGERGITLSGGQKQRTAIARALIKDPSVLLIDDGLSAVDTKTEVSIKRAIGAQHNDKTFINISHRISSVKDADQIICLDKGKVVEEGNHETLQKSGGMYAELYQKQMLSESEATF